MGFLQDMLRTRGGRIVAFSLTAVGFVALAIAMTSVFGDDEATRLARERIFVCSETLKPFEYTLVIGDSIPVKSPHSGKNTGYPSELCYWTKDAKIKQDPTPVLLNMAVGKPGPTFCPDCGRLVVPHNPYPVEGKPPPTQAEYGKRRGGAEER